MAPGRKNGKPVAIPLTIETAQTTHDIAYLIEYALRRNPSEALFEELSRLPLPRNILCTIKRRSRRRRAALTRLVEVANRSLALQYALMRFIAPGYRLCENQTTVPPVMKYAA